MKTVLVSDVSLKQIALRGEQMPLCDRSKLISALSALRVDSIELPAMKQSAEDVIVNRIAASQAKCCTVCVPVGYTEKSVEQAWEAIQGCDHARLQVEYPLSTVQLEYRFHQKTEKAMSSILALISLAKERCAEVELVLGDATRAERDFLKQVLDAAEREGVSVVTLCDDTEAALPQEIAELVRVAKANLSVPLYVQVSDLVGLGSACAIAAIEAGADGVKTSLLGENALPLNEFSNLLRVRGESLGFTANLDVTAANRTVTELMSRMDTDPAPVDQPSEAKGRILTADSTLAEVSQAVEELGYQLSAEDCGNVRRELIRVASKRGSIEQKELEAIIAGSAMAVPSTYHVETYVINSGNVISSTAQICLLRDGERLQGVSTGDGPIDAAFHAIEQIIGHHYELEDFQIQSVTRGREALGSALVKLRSRGKLYSGNGVSTDIVGASIRAYINALNKIVYEDN